MNPVTIHEAETNFLKLISLVEGGTEVVVRRGNTPIARIVPFRSSPQRRTAGALKGQIKIARDFDGIPDGFEDCTA